LGARAAFSSANPGAFSERGIAATYIFEEGGLFDDIGGVFDVLDTGEFYKDAVSTGGLHDRLGGTRAVGATLDDGARRLKLVGCYAGLVAAWLGLQDQLQAALEVEAQPRPGIALEVANAYGVGHVNVARQDGNQQDTGQPGK
jgi:hypothetical protein